MMIEEKTELVTSEARNSQGGRRGFGFPGIARNSPRGGFSFLEIMIVVLIIGVMVSVVGPRMTAWLGVSKVNATRNEMKGIDTALGLYEMKLDDFPTTEQGLKALVVRPTDVSEENWVQCYKQMPLDGWKRKFVYRCPGENGRDYDLISKGKDGMESTGDDITNIPEDLEP